MQDFNLGLWNCSQETSVHISALGSHDLEQRLGFGPYKKDVKTNHSATVPDI